MNKERSKQMAEG